MWVIYIHIYSYSHLGFSTLVCRRAADESQLRSRTPEMTPPSHSLRLKIAQKPYVALYNMVFGLQEP